MDIAEYARQKHATVKLSVNQSGMGWKKETPEGDRWRHFQQRITVKVGTHQMTLDWRQGEAHGAKLPEVADVLSSLISEGLAFEQTDGLEDFMANYGYEDRRKAQKLYRALGNQYPKIVNLFGGKEDWDYVTETIAY